MKTHGDVRFWLGVCVQSSLIFLPGIVALWFVVRFELGYSNALLYINNISDNSFVINDVLFASIFASYLVVFIGLLLYLLGIINDLTGYSGHGDSVRRLNTASVGLLWVLWSVLLVYLVVVLIACMGFLPSLTVHLLVVINKFLSLGVFGTFLVADLIGLRSKVVQERELISLKNEKTSACKQEIEKIDKQLTITRLLKRYAQEATAYVNVPTLLLNICIVVITLYLDESERLRGIVNLQLHHYLSPTANVQADIFDSFLNGVETGAIVCTIVFSQIVYLFIKTKYDLRIWSTK